MAKPKSDKKKIKKLEDRYLSLNNNPEEQRKLFLRIQTIKNTTIKPKRR